MNIAVFGGTGQTGKRIVEQALELGHSVTVLARTPEKMNISHPKLEVIQGDALVSEDVFSILPECDAVLCALGGEGLKDCTSRTKATQHIISGMKKHSVPVIVVCSVLGLGKSSQHLSFMSKLFTKILLKNPMIDHGAQEEIVLNSELEWVIIRPPRLIDGAKTEKYKLVEETEEGFVGTQVSRADVAHSMLVALNNKELIGKCLSISM